MKNLAATEQALLRLLAQNYYEVIPQELRTYCALTAEISAKVLQHFGIEAKAIPCQLLCVTATEIDVIGFTGKGGRGGNGEKWDGHAICTAGDWFIDAAVHHLQIEFGIPVPPVAYAQQFNFPSQVISRIGLNEKNSLWWYQPPAGVNTELPENPESLVAHHASKLIELLEGLKGSRPQPT